MSIQLYLQSSNYKPTPENRLQRVKDFAKNVILWQKNPQTELDIQHDQFTIDDYYQQAMLLTKAFCLVHGLEHDVISKAILEAYAKRSLRANTDNLLLTDEDNLKHVSVKHEDFSQKILETVKMTIAEKADNIESLNTQASSMIDNLFKNSDVVPYHLPDYSDKDKDYPHSNLPPQEGLRDKKGDLLPEALMRVGRAFETERGLLTIKNLDLGEKETFEKINIGLEKMFHELDIENAMINVCNFDDMSSNSKNFPVASELFEKNHTFTRIPFMEDKDFLTLPQLRVLYDAIGSPYLAKNLGLTEGLKKYFDLIENEVFIIHHIRQFFYKSLPKQKDFYHLEAVENPVLRLGMRERSCSHDNLLLENKNQYKKRVVECLRPLKDYKSYMSEALNTGTAFLKLPSGTTLICMSTPFMLKEYDSDFSFSAQDFKNLFKGMSSCLTVSGGHTELDGLSMLPIFFKVIKKTYQILSQRCKGIFEPIAHEDILQYIGRENNTINKETQYKELSPEERQKAEKLAKSYKEMIGNFLEAFYNKTDVEDLDIIDPEQDFKYKHQLFIAGQTNDERIAKSWDEVNYVKDLEAEFKRLKASHKRNVDALGLSEREESKRVQTSYQ